MGVLDTRVKENKAKKVIAKVASGGIIDATTLSPTMAGCGFSGRQT